MSNQRKYYKKNNWPSLVKFENREIWADLENRSKVVHSENFPIWRPASGHRDHVTHHVISHVTHWGQWKYASRSWHAVGSHRRQLKLMYQSKISGRGPKHCCGSKFQCRPRPAHSHLQSFATPPPRVIRHADGWGWEKMENVEFQKFLSITSCKSYCISKIIIFETVPRWLTCDYSPRNNTISHLLPAVIWWPSSRCICRCLLIGGKLNSIKFLWHYLRFHE